MASPETSKELERLTSSPASAPDKLTAYTHLLDKIIKTENPETMTNDLKAYLDLILGESLGIVLSRPLLSAFVNALRSIPDPNVKMEFSQYVLQQLQSRAVAFEEQDATLRTILAEEYEASDRHIEAAKVLQGMQLDSSQRSISDNDKVRLWIRIVRNYIEEDNTVDAEIYLNKAKGLMHKCQDQELILMFQLSQARILDANRRFLEACQAYHTISLSTVIVEEDRMKALSSAIVCGVLAPAGPQRSRTLARLYKDERAPQVPQYGILEKIFLDRLLSPAEVDSFAADLAEHQLAQTADGSTVLAKAVIEHNLVGVSKVYANIRVDDLGDRLGLSGEKAEEYAARMIQQGRLKGTIDQLDGVIYFEGEDDAAGSKLANGDTSAILKQWENNINGLLNDVEKCVALIRERDPVSISAYQQHHQPI